MELKTDLKINDIVWVEQVGFPKFMAKVLEINWPERLVYIRYSCVRRTARYLFQVTKANDSEVMLYMLENA